MRWFNKFFGGEKMIRKKNLIITLVLTFFVLNIFALISYAGVSGISDSADTSQIITIDNAKTEFLKYGKPRLMYVRPWNTSNANENRKLKLIYTLVNGPYFYFDFKGIDATTGKPINSSGEEFMQYYEKIGDQSNPAVNKKADELSKPLTENDAKLIAMKEALKYNIAINGNCVSSYNDNWLGLNQKVYTFLWSNKTDGDFKYKATVDILTGMVLEINYNNDKIKDSLNLNTPNISWQEGKDRAIDFVKSDFSEYVGSLVFMQSKPYLNAKTGDFYYYYSFWRIVNGALYPENNVNVIVDNRTGDIIGYGYRWENIDFPVIGSNIISDTMASDIFMNKIGLNLNTFYSLGIQKQDDSNNNGLVYSAGDSNAAYIDVYTGKLKDVKGLDIESSN